MHVSASGGARGGLRRDARAPFARRSARRGRRPGRDAPWRTFPRALGGAVCPNLLQRPPSGRDAREESLIFRGSAPGRSGRRAPLQQIWTTARPGPSQEPHPHHRDRAPARTMSEGPIGEELRGTTAPRAGGLTRRARVCYALCPLLRSFTLRCTRRRSAAEGEEAQQTERGAADGAERPPRSRESHGHRDRLWRAPGRGPRSRGSRFFAAQPLPRRRRTSSRIIRTASSGPTTLVSMTRRSRPHGS